MPTRDRFREIASVDESLHVNYIPPKSTSSDYDHSDWEVSHTLEAMTDFVTPDFAKKIREGHIINNPCVYTKTSTSSSRSAYAHYEDPGYEYEITGPLTRFRSSNASLPGFWDDLDINLDTQLEAKAKTSALANIDSTPYAFGEDALELRETVKFLKSPLGSLFNLSRNFKRQYNLRKKVTRFSNYKPNPTALKILEQTYGKLDKSTLRLAQAHAGVWLNYRFAVSPLVRSCMDVLEAYSEELPVLPERLTSRGFANDSGYKEKLGWTYGGRGYDISKSYESDVKASILYEVSNPIRDWRYRLGFRVKDWPTTIWQILPYSFMVDRLVNITDLSKGVINLVDPNVKILSACTRRKATTTTLYELVQEVAACDILQGEVVKDEAFIYDRQPWTPSIRDTIPVVTPLFLVKDATHVSDLVSLILSNFRF
jgi:hypothetical protein